MDDGKLGIGIATPADLNSALLGRLAYNLDLSDAQHDRAKSAYETISEVLASDARPPLRDSKVFPQGSFALGTVVKPWASGDDEFDVDLICRLGAPVAGMAPTLAKSLIGTCLSNDARYSPKLEEKPRCWRVNYAGEFHLDVAPVISSGSGGDLIPDRDLRQWIVTHPEAYAAWFNNLANQARTRVLLEGRVVAKAEIAPFPADLRERGWLRRLVQLLKRHRDMWKQSLPAAHREFAPISIIITTLAAYAFERVKSRSFATPIDLLRSIVDDMPTHAILRKDGADHEEWWVPSPVANENFANRWNDNSMWHKCFFSWCKSVAGALEKLDKSSGLDECVASLRESFGDSAANAVAQDFGNAIRVARDSGSLRMTKSGLVVTGAAVGNAVRPHTFFGNE